MALRRELDEFLASAWLAPLVIVVLVAIASANGVLVRRASRRIRARSFHRRCPTER